METHCQIGIPPGTGAAPRVGILGGSFDPPHLGHLLLAQDAREQVALDRVLLLPCRQSPHKPGRRPAPGNHRLTMLEMALKGTEGLEVCDLELRRKGVSYTVETLDRLHALHPGTHWFWIIGADMLSELHTWKDVDRLITLCDMIVCDRPGEPSGKVPPGAWRLSPGQVRSLRRHRMAGRSLALSSSEIRARVHAGRSIHFMVPPAVEDYIIRNRLYR